MGLRSAAAVLVAAVALAASPTAATPAPVPGQEAPSVEPPGVAVEPPPTEPAEDAPPDEAPPPPAGPVAPPADPPPPPTPEQARAQGVLQARLNEARAGLAGAAERHAAAVDRQTGIEAALTDASAGLQGRRDEEGRASTRAETAKARVRRWGVQLYAGASLRPVAIMIDLDHIGEAPRRLALTSGALAAARRSLREHEAVVAAASSDVRARAAALDELALALEEARQATVSAQSEMAAWQRDVAALEAGVEIAVVGLVFPLVGASTFVDTFGAPRMTGTPFAHAHEGVDIFAAAGSPVAAIEPGVLARVGVDRLGGNKLWLVGRSGTMYYYAHLQGYAAGVADGVVVGAGQVIGAVGNTGNARFTPHHLHFEIHPGGGAAVNPYPILRYVVEGATAAPPPVAPAPAGPRTGPNRAGKETDGARRRRRPSGGGPLSGARWREPAPSPAWNEFGGGLVPGFLRRRGPPPGPSPEPVAAASRRRPRDRSR